MSEQAPLETRRLNHAGFNQYLAEGRFMAARCVHCGEINLPPRPLCPRCFQSTLEWVELSGEGWLEGFTIIHLGLPHMIARGYSRQNPYCSGVVRLKEGPAITAQILAANDPSPVHAPRLAGIRVGAPVRAVFLSQENSIPVSLAFKITHF